MYISRPTSVDERTWIELAHGARIVWFAFGSIFLHFERAMKLRAQYR
jgi:hypothetical protein